MNEGFEAGVWSRRSLSRQGVNKRENQRASLMHHHGPTEPGWWITMHSAGGLRLQPPGTLLPHAFNQGLLLGRQEKVQCERMMAASLRCRRQDKCKIGSWWQSRNGLSHQYSLTWTHGEAFWRKTAIKSCLMSKLDEWGALSGLGPIGESREVGDDMCTATAASWRLLGSLSFHLLAHHLGRMATSAYLRTGIREFPILLTK